MKNECTRIIIVPLNFLVVWQELALYTKWYNHYRPHQTLDGRTPNEVRDNSPPVRMIEAKSNSKLPDIKLQISYLGGKRHLPTGCGSH